MSTKIKAGKPVRRRTSKKQPNPIQLMKHFTTEQTTSKKTLGNRRMDFFHNETVRINVDYKVYERQELIDFASNYLLNRPKYRRELPDTFWSAFFRLSSTEKALKLVNEQLEMRKKLIPEAFSNGARAERAQVLRTISRIGQQLPPAHWEALQMLADVLKNQKEPDPGHVGEMGDVAQPQSYSHYGIYSERPK